MLWAMARAVAVRLSLVAVTLTAVAPVMSTAAAVMPRVVAMAITNNSELSVMWPVQAELHKCSPKNAHAALLRPMFMVMAAWLVMATA